MRLLHTSDWHVGKTNFGVGRDADHDHVFEQIRDIAKDEKVDLILHTGDLYEKPDPGTDVLKRGIGYIEELAEVAPLIMVVGNHDSNGMFELIDALISRRPPRAYPIHIFHTARLKSQGLGLLELGTKNGKQRILFAGLPFVRPASFAKQFAMLGAGLVGLEFADQMERLTHRIADQYRVTYDPSTDVRLFGAHVLLQGSVVGGKDRGERPLDIEQHTFGVRSGAVPVVDYAGLGHVHKAQTPPGCSYARYAGSPLAVDFGESGEPKGIQLVEITPGLPTTPRFMPLDVGRELISLTLRYEDLPTQGPLLAGKVVKLTVLLEGSERNVYDRVRECLPDAVIARVIEQVVFQPAAEAAEPVDLAAISPPDLFDTYILGRSGVDKELTGRYFRELYAGAIVGERIAIADVDRLEEQS